MDGEKVELWDPEAEANLLACGLAEPDVFAADVAPADFHDLELGRLWEVGQDLHRRGLWASDSELLQQGLRERGYDVTLTRLVELLARDVWTVNAGEYARMVREYAQKRLLQAQLAAAHTALYTGNGNWRELAAEPLKLAAERLAAPKPGKPPRITGWTAAELLAAQFPEPVWAVPDMIPVGLTILGGRPKVGKSWLALQIAIAASTGGMVLERRVKQGKVLYIALEDNGRRLRDRASKQMMPASAALRFETTWPRLTEGGTEALEKAITEQRYTLVVLDTLGRATGRARTDDYGDMTDLLGQLQEQAMTHDIALLVLDHHRKSSGQISDPVDDIIGSTAKSGTADGALGLSKEQGKRGAVLSVDGREVLRERYSLSWDALTCCWQLEGTVEEVQLQGRRGDVLAALRESGEPMTLTEIATVTDLGKNNVQPILNELVNDGQIERLPKQGREVPYRLRSA